MAPSELPFRIEGRRIWIAGHRGMVGSALMRRLAREDCKLVTVDRDRLDLRRQAEVQAWMHEVKPDVVVLAAARVGGIYANASRPADFLDDNLALQTNVIRTAADQRILVADRPAGADQPVVRHRQDRGPDAMPGLSRTAPLRLHLGDAD